MSILKKILTLAHTYRILNEDIVIREQFAGEKVVLYIPYWLHYSPLPNKVPLPITVRTIT